MTFYTLNCSTYTNSSIVFTVLRTKFIFLAWSVFSALYGFSLFLQVPLLNSTPSHPPQLSSYFSSLQKSALLPLQAICTCCSLCQECLSSPLFTDIGTFLCLNSLSPSFIYSELLNLTTIL